MAEHQALENLFQHLEETLVEINFLDPHNPRQLMNRFRRLFLRGRLDTQEVNLMRGLLSQTQKTLRLAKAAESQTRD